MNNVQTLHKMTQTVLVMSLLFSSLLLAAPNPSSPVVIADEPMDVTKSVPINMMLLADDSGSMTWTHAPEGIGDIERACWRGADGIIGGGPVCTPLDPNCHIIDVCGYPYPNPYRTNDLLEAQKKAVTVLPPPLAANGFNNMAYNPENIYRPPVFFKEDGTMASFPSMKDASEGWTKVGWPDEVEGIQRPVGVPVTLNFRDIQTLYPTERNYKADQRYTLQHRYMVNASSAQENELNKIMGATPLHYFRTSVKWCKYYQSRSATSDGNPVTPDNVYEGVLFLDSASPQDCQKERTDEYKYPYYYYPYGEYYTPNRENHLLFPSFTVVVLDYADPSTGSAVTYGAFDDDGNFVEKTRPYEEELENYANWYAYYSNRTAATRTVTTFALAGIDEGRMLRMGFTTINSSSSIDKPIDTYAHGTVDGNKNKYEIFKQLLEHTVDPVANYGTPLKTGIDNVRRAFSGDDFVIYSCQRNYTVALTDGLWNDDNFSGVSNQDYKVTVTPPKPVRVLGTDLVQGSFWPYPLREGATQTSNSLADVSLYAWLNDLRSDMFQYDVDQTTQDPAEWRHMNLIALSYGSEGTLTGDQGQLLRDIRDQSKEWPVPLKNDPTAVDDLWHGTLTGFGVYASSTNPDKFDTAIEHGTNFYQTGLSSILNRGGNYAEVAFSLDRLTDTTEYYYYQVNFSAGWSGDLIKRELFSDVKAWDASQSLADRLDISGAWETDRNIFTALPNGVGVAFTFDNLDATQRATLHPTDATEQKDIIAYLRGDTSNEFVTFGDGKYRARTGPLGDFVHGSPVFVPDEPEFHYNDDGYESDRESLNVKYSEFKDKFKGRKPAVYAVGNDGMLHAFHAGIGTRGSEELWSFIPPELFRAKEDRGIVNLALLPEEGTKWQHYYHIDATPRIIDADLNNAQSEDDEPDWRTVLIGGMGKGGTSYYALDVTDPGNLNGDQNADAFMWTFTDPNMGYTFGRALIVKMRMEDISTSGGFVDKWVAILPSGINNGTGEGQPKNGDGRGRIFIVDIKDGTPLFEMVTPNAGTPERPNGLTFIRGFVVGEEDQRVLDVYGGDQLGNVWRFSFLRQDPGTGKFTKVVREVTRIAELKDPDGLPQPVNTEPRMEVTKKGKDDEQRWVLIGTGRFYDDKDLYDRETGTYIAPIHSVYALKDGTWGSSDPSLAVYDRSDLDDITGAPSPTLSSDKGGWVNDLEKGFQMITNMDSLSGGSELKGYLAFAANRFLLPGAEGLNPCATSLFESRLYQRELITGFALTGGSGGARDYHSSYQAGLTTIKYLNDPDHGIILAYVTLEKNTDSDWVPPNIHAGGGGGAAGNPSRRSTIRYIQ
jgi:Tfp pilus assembly protein, tip-associated adhesin PilY1